MSFNKIETYKSIIIFSLEQLKTFLDGKHEDYKENSEIKDNKPIVHKENLALLEEEAVYIEHTRRYLEGLDVSGFDSRHELNKYILQDLSELYKKRGIPKVCYIIIKEKLDNCLDFYDKLFS